MSYLEKRLARPQCHSWPLLRSRCGEPVSSSAGNLAISLLARNNNKEAILKMYKAVLAATYLN